MPTEYQQSLEILADAVSSVMGPHGVVGSLRMAAHSGESEHLNVARQEFDSLDMEEKISVARCAKEKAQDVVADGDGEEDGDEEQAALAFLASVFQDD